MMVKVAQPRARGEDGFSLVELVVIVVIIGILAAIATATYLNQRQRGEQASAVSTLTNVRLVAESLRAQGSNDFSSEFGAYNAEESAYEFRPGGALSTDQRIVSVDPDAGGGGVSFAVLGNTHCYFMRLEQGNGEIIKSTSTELACRADVFDPDDATGSWG